MLCTEVVKNFIDISPELNRIERFWHAIKFTWMAPKCRDSKMLEADVDEILDNFGAIHVNFIACQNLSIRLSSGLYGGKKYSVTP